MSDLVHDLAVNTDRLEFIEKQIEYVTARRVIKVNRGLNTDATENTLKHLAEIGRVLLREQKLLKGQIQEKAQRRRALRKLTRAVGHENSDQARRM